MFTTVFSAAVYGLQAYLVRVEVDLAGGLPSFQLVGSLGSEVKESRERVSVAMKNSGFQIPPAHITVNLAPAGRRKDGTAFDLPVAVGLLRDMELVPEEALQDTLFLGELGLNGEIKKVKGVLPIVQEAAKSGIRRVVVPGENAMEAAVIPGITVWGVNCLNDLLAALNHPELETEKVYQPRIRAEDLLREGTGQDTGDFREVAGQENAKRGAEIAAAGFHNLLMIGPPGVGKSMVAGRIPGILPASDTERKSGGDRNLQCGGTSAAGTGTDHKEAFLCTTPYCDTGSTDRRGKRHPKTWYGIAGPSGCTVSGRASGIPEKRAGWHATAYGGA